VARLDRQSSPAEVVVALDEDGSACGWLTRHDLVGACPERAVAEVMDEDLPSVPPDIPAEAAADIMRDRGLDYLFLMHDWPGERRPAAFLSRHKLERYQANEPLSAL
jgi:CBS domain-containing protein